MSLYSLYSRKCCEMGPVAPAGNLRVCQLARTRLCKEKDIRRANGAVHDYIVIRNATSYGRSTYHS